jgi:polyhydroxyalkanoate synthesis regulator phasin
VKLALKDQLALVLSWLPTPGTRVPPAPSAAEASLWADLGGMKLALEASALTLEETRKTLNETQKYLDEARSELEAANTEIGRLRNELSGCPMGRYCDLHEARHGREAEELRERFEYLASRVSELQGELKKLRSPDIVRMRKLDWDAVHLDARAAKAEKEKFEAALKSTVAECRRLHILIERAGLDPNAVIRYHLCPNCRGVMYETETVCAICSYAPPEEPQ